MSARPVKYCRDGVEVDYTTGVVRIRNNRSGTDGARALDVALSQFKKMLEKEGTLSDLRDREYFKSKSQREYEHKRKARYYRQVEKEKLERIPRRKRLQEQGK